MQYVAELAGQDAVCPTCGKIFNVPTVEQTVTVTNSTVSQGPAASATSPFGGGDTPVKPLPPQYAHLKKDAKGGHTTKIVWVCFNSTIVSKREKHHVVTFKFFEHVAQISEGYRPLIF